jgi:hypothetical protein
MTSIVQYISHDNTKEPKKTTKQKKTKTENIFSKLYNQNKPYLSLGTQGERGVHIYQTPCHCTDRLEKSPKSCFRNFGDGDGGDGDGVCVWIDIGENRGTV